MLPPTIIEAPISAMTPPNPAMGSASGRAPSRRERRAATRSASRSPTPGARAREWTRSRRRPPRATRSPLAPRRAAGSWRHILLVLAGDRNEQRSAVPVDAEGPDDLLDLG